MANIIDIDAYTDTEVKEVPQWCLDVQHALLDLKKSSLNITQEKMAKDLECSRQTIWNAISGKGCTPERKKAILQYVRDKQIFLESQRQQGAS